jgi:hypothetical protein
MRHVPNAPKRRKPSVRTSAAKPPPRGLARLPKRQRDAVAPVFREHLTMLLRAIAEEYAIHESTEPERYARPARGLLAGVEQALRRYIADIEAIVEPADAGREAA